MWLQKAQGSESLHWTVTTFILSHAKVFLVCDFRWTSILMQWMSLEICLKNSSKQTFENTWGNNNGQCYAKRSLISWVFVIPKEWWVCMATPSLLLVWHRLSKNIIYEVSRVKFWEFGVMTVSQAIRDFLCDASQVWMKNMSHAMLKHAYIPPNFFGYDTN